MISRLLYWLRYNLAYFGNPPWDTGISPPELIEFLSSHSTGRAVDLGCGTGTNLVTLARAGWDVTGVDFAIKAVRWSRQRLERQGLTGEVLQGDVTHFSSPNQPFDLVLDIGCYHGLPKSSRLMYLVNLQRLLKVKGTFLVYCHLNVRLRRIQALGMMIWLDFNHYLFYKNAWTASIGLAGKPSG